MHIPYITLLFSQSVGLCAAAVMAGHNLASPKRYTLLMGANGTSANLLLQNETNECKQCYCGQMPTTTADLQSNMRVPTAKRDAYAVPKARHTLWTSPSNQTKSEKGTARLVQQHLSAFLSSVDSSNKCWRSSQEKIGDWLK